jgi:hypothetical protein
MWRNEKMKSMKKVVVCMAILAMVGVASAQYVEGWDTWVDNEQVPFTPGSNQGWEVKSGTPSTNPYTGDDSTTLGDPSFYPINGMALRTNSSNDYEIRHTTAGVDFGLTLAEVTGAGGITAGFNHRMAWTGGGSGWRAMMNLREGTVASSPQFGYEWDSVTGTTRWTLRKIDGTRIYGNALTGNKASLDALGIRESWLSVSMDYDGQFATLNAQHIFPSETIGSAVIDTGLVGIDLDLGLSLADMADLNRMQIRTGGTSKIWLDNLSIDTMAVPEPATLALLSLGGLLLRRKK